MDRRTIDMADGNVTQGQGLRITKCLGGGGGGLR